MLSRHLLLSIFLATIASTFTTANAQQEAPTRPEMKPPATIVRQGTKPQELYLTKITVSDLLKSYEFYTKVIGLKLVTSPDMELPKAPAAGDPEKDFVEIALNYSGSMRDPLFVLMKRRGKSPSPESASMTSIGFKVLDARATVERAIQAGYKSLRDLPVGGRPGFVADPDGYTVELVQGPSFEK
jgi:catechol 2,3-dioxygenase-like lactoylglutathione lyase family enzyme